MPSVESVRDHIEEIRDIEDYIVPTSSMEELMMLGQVLAD